MTEADFISWLQTSGQKRILLAQMINRHDDALHNVYIANTAYVSNHTSNAGNATDESYDPYILEVPEFSRSLNDNLLGRATLSYGELVVMNNNGELDSWFDYSWGGFEIKLLLGGEGWHIDDFQPILIGVVGKEPFSRSKREIVFEIGDKGERLNKMLQSESYTTGENEGNLKPVCIGQCLNVTPSLIDEPQHEYQVHHNAVTDITAVRIRGLNAASFTKTNSTGKFKSGVQPTGAVTADLVGHSATNNYPGQVATHIAKTYGGLTDAEIDSTVITTTDLSVPYTLGFFSNKEINIIDVLDNVCSSVGAFWDFNRFGKLIVTVLTLAAGSPVLELTADDLEKDGLNHLRDIPARWKVTVGYQKNWTKQSDLAGDVSESNRLLYTTEYRNVVAKDEGVLTKYPNAEILFLPTLLVNKAHAQLEASKWLSFFAVKRRVFEIQALAAPFTVKIGDVISLDHPRFGWSGGKLALVIGIKQKPTNNKVTLEVLR